MAKKQKDRGPDLMSKYVWLIDTIYRAKWISYNELNERWKRETDFSRGEDLPKRTLKRWLDTIEMLFGIDIENEGCGDYRYYIDDDENLAKKGLRSWLFDSFTVSNALVNRKSIRDRILLEYVPTGQEYLQTIIDAMKENREIQITYYNPWKDEEFDLKLQPLCVRLFRQRWYVIALNHYPWLCKDGPRIYSLERIRALQVRDETFKMPKDWNAEEYFEGCFGVIRDHDYDKELVKLKVTAGQANYIRGLRLHESQKEVERNDEYSIFTLFVRPTFDFIQELFWQGEDVEVLEPLWFREEIAGKINRMWNKYRKKAMKLITKLTNFSSVDESRVEQAFEDIAKTILYDGYIKVRNEYRVYVKTVEFYFHAEEGSLFKSSDPIVYHRNGRFPGINLPYFPVLTLHAHVSGLDITFENEQYKYRASALIRAYSIYDVKNETFIRNEKGEIYDDRSTFLYNYLNGFSLDGRNEISWIDEESGVAHVIAKPSPRRNVYVYVDGKKTSERDERPWSFTRVNEIEP